MRNTLTESLLDSALTKVSWLMGFFYLFHLGLVPKLLPPNPMMKKLKR